MNFRLLFLLALLLFFAGHEIASENRPSLLQPGLRMYAYITAEGDGSASLTTGGTVSVVDLVGLSAVATIPVGPSPSGIRAHPTREEVWGVSSDGGYVWIIDVHSSRMVARIEVGAAPFAVDFSPDGNRAYVAASGAGTVAAIDCAALRVVQRARAGRRPWLARVTPDGQTLVVPNRDDNTVTLFDAATLTPLATLPVAPRPDQVVILDDGSKAFVSASQPGRTRGVAAQVSVVDLKTRALLANLPLGGNATDLVAASAKKGKLYVLSPESHSVTVVDTWRNEVESFLVAGSAPSRAVLNGEGTTLYVSDAGAGQITPLLTGSGRPEKPTPTGQRPGVCRLTPGEELLLVVNEDSNNLAVIRTRPRRLITVIPVGQHPRDLAIKVF